MRQPTTSRKSSKLQVPTIIEELMDAQMSSEDDDEDGIESIEMGHNSEFISFTKDNSVLLTSPTFGDKIKIKDPKVKFGSSRNALRELKHIEC